MSKRKKRDKNGGLVYSTNNNIQFDDEDDITKEPLAAGEQSLKIHLDRLGGGKLLTRVVGFACDEVELTKLGKELKQKCGVGGSIKNGEILIQGNHRDKVLLILLNIGYNAKKAGG